MSYELNFFYIYVALIEPYNRLIELFIIRRKGAKLLNYIVGESGCFGSFFGVLREKLIDFINLKIQAARHPTT